MSALKILRLLNEILVKRGLPGRIALDTETLDL